MARKRYKPEEIVAKLRQVDVQSARSAQALPQAIGGQPRTAVLAPIASRGYPKRF
jgi:hypothetical protein